MPIEWVKREWVTILMFFLTLAASAYGAWNGLNGATAVVGVAAFVIVMVIGLTRPKLTPYIIVLFTVFDRDLHLPGPVQLTTLTIVLLLLAPGFLRVILTGNAVPRFALVGSGILVMGLVLASLASEHPELAWPGMVAKLTSTQNGDLVRSQLQAGGLQVLTQSPLGIGFNNFSALVASGDIYSTLALAHAHNTFIQMGLDAGWLGGAGFLVLVVGSFWLGFRSKGDAIAVGFAAALAGFLVQVSQDYFFFEEASLVAFGLLVAGSMGQRRQTYLSTSDQAGLAVPSARSSM